ncbi:MAG TPA: cache domain-containing protein, partial [Candidatus Kapabacteria bacterium]|nr:cache domain-containing protein [Candidatus Kapabacteria bacterium]
MAAKSLQQHIQRLIGFTLLVVSLAILLAVWFSTGSHVRTQISNDLEVGHSVLTQLLETREQQLLNSAEVLTADFGFKQAVASGDAATAQSALDNHGERIQADLMALLSLDGTVTVTTRSALATG